MVLLAAQGMPAAKIAQVTFTSLDRSRDVITTSTPMDAENMLGHQLPEPVPPFADFWATLDEIFAWLAGEVTLVAPQRVERPDLDPAWVAPRAITSWRRGFPFELIRYAGVNRLKVDVDLSSGRSPGFSVPWSRATQQRLGDPHRRRIDFPAVADAMPARPSSLGEQRRGPQHPPVHGDVVDLHAALDQQHNAAVGSIQAVLRPARSSGRFSGVEGG